MADQLRQVSAPSASSSNTPPITQMQAGGQNSFPMPDLSMLGSRISPTAMSLLQQSLSPQGITPMNPGTLPSYPFTQAQISAAQPQQSVNPLVAQLMQSYQQRQQQPGYWGGPVGGQTGWVG